MSIGHVNWEYRIGQYSLDRIIWVHTRPMTGMGPNGFINEMLLSDWETTYVEQL